MKLNDLIVTLLEQLSEIESKTTEGEIDSVSAYVALKKIEKAVKNTSSIISEYALPKLLGMGRSELQGLPFGAEGQIRSTKKYAFMENKKYAEKKGELDELEERLKMASDKNASMTDEDGEMLYPVKVTTTTTCAISKI